MGVWVDEPRAYYPILCINNFCGSGRVNVLLYAFNLASRDPHISAVVGIAGTVNDAAVSDDDVKFSGHEYYFLPALFNKGFVAGFFDFFSDFSGDRGFLGKRLASALVSGSGLTGESFGPPLVCVQSWNNSDKFGTKFLIIAFLSA
jgi:hypothetical protein